MLAASTGEGPLVNITECVLGNGTLNAGLDFEVPDFQPGDSTLINPITSVSPVWTQVLTGEEGQKDIIEISTSASTVNNHYVTEFGFKDSDGDLIVIGSHPPAQFPVAQGDARHQFTIKSRIAANSAPDIVVLTDPDVIYLTREEIEIMIERSPSIKRVFSGSTPYGVNFTQKNYTLPYSIVPDKSYILINVASHNTLGANHAAPIPSIGAEIIDANTVRFHTVEAWPATVPVPTIFFQVVQGAIPE